jgi:hypothetical protein
MVENEAMGKKFGAKTKGGEGSILRVFVVLSHNK